MNYELLSHSPIFKGLDAATTEMILGKINYRIRKYPVGSVIAISGEEITSLHIVLAGMVKGEMVDYEGRTLKIEDIGAPRALAPAFMFGSGNRFPVNVTAVTEAELLIIDKHDFVKLLRSDDHLLSNYLDTISNRSQFLSDKIRFFTFRTIKGKLANYILEKAGRNLAKIRFGRTQQELAEFFGVARPSLSRALKELEDDGFIIAEGKEMTILNREGLVKLTRQQG
jgi:CRP/FNR family transcriptional regulator, dissimilatory nitrate respiration regulator